MSAESADLWRRAMESLSVAEHDVALSPDAAASRAYYAAFYAVSAHFALEDRYFTKHTAVESAVHRDLVHAGIWPREFGVRYSDLSQLRVRGDYGVADHVDEAEAARAIKEAAAILEAVAALHPGEFVMGKDGPHS
ncbi:MAG: HEPN domain-containing protein [Phycisphaerae bacterium]